MEAILALIKTKLFIIIAAVAVTATTATIITVTVLNAPDTYRIVKVFEINGTSTIARKNTGEMEAYVGMSLETGDKITVAPNSTLRLVLDDNKYILLDASTEITLNADGNAENSKTVIDLKKGTILNQITQKLSSDSSYEVNTPTSTMSVRGTIFAVTVTEDGDETHTYVNVLDGTVGGKIIFPDGTTDGKEVAIPKGKAAEIKKDSKTTVWVFDDKDVDLTTLPKSVLYALKGIIEDGKSIAVSVQDIMNALFPKEAETTTAATTTTTAATAYQTTEDITHGTTAPTTATGSNKPIVTTVPITAQTTEPTTVVPETSVPKVTTTTPETTSSGGTIKPWIQTEETTTAADSRTYYITSTHGGHVGGDGYTFNSVGINNTLGFKAGDTISGTFSVSYHKPGDDSSHLISCSFSYTITASDISKRTNIKITIDNLPDAYFYIDIWPQEESTPTMC